MQKHITDNHPDFKEKLEEKREYFISDGINRTRSAKENTIMKHSPKSSL